MTTEEASQSQWPSMEEPEKGESPTNLSIETASVGSVDSVTPSPTPQPVQTQKVGTAEACNLIELAIKVIVDVEQCHPVTRAVCTESTEEVDNEICTYSYQPTPGYHSYGYNYCKEVAQETCYNVPVVTPVEPAIEVAYPVPISLPRKHVVL